MILIDNSAEAFVQKVMPCENRFARHASASLSMTGFAQHDKLRSA
jgi:hypothetical protein